MVLPQLIGRWIFFLYRDNSAQFLFSLFDVGLTTKDSPRLSTIYIHSLAIRLIMSRRADF